MDTWAEGRAVRRFSAAALALAVVAAAPAGRAGERTRPWEDRGASPAARSAALLAAMTLDEKFEQMVGAPGVVPEIAACYGARHIPGVPRLGIPTLRVTNGPVGIGQNDCVPATAQRSLQGALMSTESAKATAFPSAMAIAASFDPTLAFRFGDTMGVEARALALHVLEAPGVNLARVPQAGRNFEYFGEDPYLSGIMAVREIRGVQGRGVIAMVKHFVANEQETNRMAVNESVDDRTLNELYLLPFEMAVKEAGVASVMCSYNKINGYYACEHKENLTDILRNRWGFDGYVQSDFFAIHSTAATLLAGTDLEMPGSNGARDFFTAQKLQAALDAREIAVSDIDRALSRRYVQMFRLGIFDRPLVQTPIDVRKDAAIARSIGEQSAVLLKNAGGLLPLDARKPVEIALIGKAAYAAKAVSGCCGGSSDVIPFQSVTPLQGIRDSLARAGGKGRANLTIVADDNSNLADAVAAARKADIAIVFAGTISEEGRDLPSIQLPGGQDELISAVAEANPRTVVVLKDNASALLPWVDRVPAVLEAWFPGQEDGAIVARLLFGEATPSGKLPVTFPKRMEDLPIKSASQWPGLDPTGAPVPLPGQAGAAPANRQAGGSSVQYSEGLNIGYRWFDASRTQPLYPFGFGLSYTSFRLSKLRVRPRAVDGRQPITVIVNVKNTGPRRGAETPQVYLRLPGAADEPAARLVGFQKVWLNPGEQRDVYICVDPAAANHPLGAWGPGQSWTTYDGAYQVAVGNSARTLLSAVLTVDRRRKSAGPEACSGTGSVAPPTGRIGKRRR
jgi:beta-glucosidase